MAGRAWARGADGRLPSGLSLCRPRFGTNVQRPAAAERGREQIVTHKERLVIEKFLRVADRMADLRTDPGPKHAAITWLRSLLNSDQIRKEVGA